MRKVECLVPSVSSITGFQTALTSNKFFILLVLIIAFTASCYVASQYIFSLFLLLVCPCCNDVRLIVLHKTSIQQSTISSYQYISKCTAPVLTEYTCNIYLIIRTKLWLEDAYDDEQMNVLECQSTYVKCLYMEKGCIIHGGFSFHCDLQSCGFFKKCQKQIQCQLHRITAVIPVLERSMFECLYSEVKKQINSRAIKIRHE